MILENPRFQLIPAAPELAEAVCGYYVRNREFLTPYDPRREPVFFTPDYQRLLLAQDQAMSQAGSGHRFYIRLAEEPELVPVQGPVLRAALPLILTGRRSADHLPRPSGPAAAGPPPASCT